MITKRILLAVVAAIGLGFVTASAASAQAYPSRPIRIIVPFLAGGTVDIVARQIGQQLSVLLGQPVVIDNRPGGGTTIALKAVATSEPDGYTLLLGSTGSLTINPILFKNIEFPGIRNLVPVGMIVTTTNLFAVRSALAGEVHRRTRRLREEQSRQAQSRRFAWRSAASVGRIRQGKDWHRHALCSLPQHGCGDSRFPVRADSGHQREQLGHAAAYPGRSRARVGGGWYQAPARASRRADVARSRIERLSGRSVDGARRPWAARPRRSSSGSTAPSTKLCDPRRRERSLPGSDSTRGPDRRRSLRHA